jgi:hypothetical protein
MYLKYFINVIFILVVLIILTFFYNISHEHSLGFGKTGIVLNLFTILIFLIGVFALSALMMQKRIVKYITGRLLLKVIVTGILLNVFLFNNLSFQELPAIKKRSDNSMVTYNNVVTYSNPEYPIYFYCNDRYPNSVLFANLKDLNSNGISNDLLKAWGSVREIKNSGYFSEAINDSLILPTDTLTVIGDTIFLAELKHVKPSLNDTIYFISSGKKVYIIGK